MKTKNWLKKNYPYGRGAIATLFSEEQIREYLIRRKYDLAVLTKDIECHKRGTIFFVKMSGHMTPTGWDGTYNIRGLFCCSKKLTTSGYHSVDIFDRGYYLILKDWRNRK